MTLPLSAHPDPPEKEPPKVGPHVECPHCGHLYSVVVDTIDGAKRRRECLNPGCKRRYNTREVIDAA